MSSGNSWGQSPTEATATGRYQLRLTHTGGVEQLIVGLEPDTQYHASAWVKVSSAEDAISLGLRDGKGGTIVQTDSGSTQWHHLIVPFTTGLEQTTVVLFMEKSAGEGSAYAANLGLQKVFDQ